MHGKDGSTERSIRGDAGVWSKADYQAEAAGRGEVRGLNLTRSGRALKLQIALEKLSK